MSDNIQVSIRIKPLTDDVKTCIKLDPNLNNTIVIENQQDQKYFYFDYVAPQEASQEDIFEIVGRKQAINCLEGYNGCVFVYGQTGSGKTHTMIGTPKNLGLLPRVIDFLFTCIYQEQNEYPDVEYLVKCSYLEIYNEHIIDLLNPSSGNLQLREDIKKGVYVEYLSEESCTNSNDALEVLSKGAINRHISCTNMNIESSRAHSVFTIQVESQRQSTQTQVINHRFSRFHFVDLAGSERQKQSQVQGDRLREGCNINKSLHILGNVINALVDDNSSNKYVHYRDSKLTFLLKDSLGGNSRTHLIANIQQSVAFYQETLSTLMFSKRVKQVKNRARINEDESGNLESLKNEIKRLKQELARNIVQNHQISWESPKRKEKQSVLQSQQFLQSLELEGIMINDQKYIKLEEILKCYLEQSTESETALYLELEKYLSGLKQLQEGFQAGSQLEQQLKLIIRLQNDAIQRLKSKQPDDGSLQYQFEQVYQNILGVVQNNVLVMKTFQENINLKEEKGQTQNVEKAQIQIQQNIHLLKDIIDTVNSSLQERKTFQNQLEGKLSQIYVTAEDHKQVEIENNLLKEQIQLQEFKLEGLEQQLESQKLQINQQLEIQGFVVNQDFEIVDVKQRDQQLECLKNEMLQKETETLSIQQTNIEQFKQISNLNQIINIKDIEIQNLKDKLSIEQSNINNGQIENDQLQQQINILKHLNNQQQQQIQTNELNYQTLQTQFKLLQTQNENEQREFLKREDNYVQKMQEYELQLYQMKQKQQEHTENLELIRSDHQTQQQEFELKIQELNDIIKGDQSKIAILETQNDDYQSEIKELLIQNTSQEENHKQKERESKQQFENQVQQLRVQLEQQYQLQINQLNQEQDQQTKYLEDRLNSKYEDLLQASEQEKHDIQLKLNNELRKAQNQIDNMNKQSSTQLQDIEILQQQLDEQKKKFLDSKDELYRQQSQQVMELKDKLKDKSSTIMQQKQEIEIITQQFQQKLESQENEHNHFINDLNLQNQEEKDNLLNQISNLQNKVKSHEISHAQQLEQLKYQHQQEMNIYKDKNHEAIQSQLQNLNTKYNEQLQEQENELIEKYEAQIIQMEQEMQAQINEIRNSLNKKTIESDNLQVSLNQKEREFRTLQQHNFDLNKQFEETKEQYLIENEQQDLKMQQKLQQLNMQIIEIQKENENQQNKLVQQLKEQQQGHDQEKQQIRSQFQTSIDELNTKIHSLEQKYTEIENLNIEKLETQKQQYDEKIKQLIQNHQVQLKHEQELLTKQNEQRVANIEQSLNSRQKKDLILLENDHQSKIKQISENLREATTQVENQHKLLNQKDLQINILKQQIEDQKQIIAEVRESQQQFVNRSEESHFQIQQHLQDKINQQALQIQNIEEEKLQYIEKQTSVERQILKQSQQLGNLEQQLLDYQQLNKNLNDQIGSINTLLQQERETLKLEKNKTQRITQSFEQQNQQIMQLNQEILRLNDEVVNQKRMNLNTQEFEKQLIDQQNQNKVLNEQIIVLKNSLIEDKKQQKLEKSKHQKSVSTLEQQNTQLNQQAQEQQKQNEDLLHKLMKIRSEHDNLAYQLKENKEKYNQLREQFCKLEEQIGHETQLRDQYIQVAEQVTKENHDLKIKLDKKTNVIQQLESALVQNEETLKNVHEKAREFCKQQEKEINDIKDQYLKLESEHNAILNQNQDREDENEQIREEKMMALMQMQGLQEEVKQLKFCDQKQKKEIFELNDKLQKTSNERSMLIKQIEEMQREIMQLGGHNNPSQKIRYLNQVKQENSCLKQEKQYLSEQLQKEIEEKNKLITIKKIEQENPVSDKIKLLTENQRLNSEMQKLNQILNLSGIKNRYSTIKGTEGDKIIQSVQLLIQELIDCKQEIQQRNKEQDSKSMKFQSMEKDLLLTKQKLYQIQREQPQKAQSPHGNPENQILKDNRQNHSGSAQRQIKNKQVFQFQQ
ncbi:hypothetical protein pb186bvf_020027 [Paramecium bursaria]